MPTRTVHTSEGTQIVWTTGDGRLAANEPWSLQNEPGVRSELDQERREFERGQAERQQPAHHTSLPEWTPASRAILLIPVSLGGLAGIAHVVNAVYLNHPADDRSIPITCFFSLIGLSFGASAGAIVGLLCLLARWIILTPFRVLRKFTQRRT
jgi:hypothetical protein